MHSARVIVSPDPRVYATEVDSDRHYAKHWHTTYGFGLIARGAHRSASPVGAVDAYAGDIVCMNPGDVHDGRPLGGPSRRWYTIYIEPDVLAPIAGRNDAAFTKPAFADARLRRSIADLLRCMEHGDAFEFDQALTLACGLMLRDHSTAAPCAFAADPDLTSVRDRLADAPVDPPTLDELAALAGLNKFQLLRRFRKQFGATPHDWLLQRRADRARALIREGFSLGEAAAASGFADQAHMTRVFVQRYGFTPGAWKQGVSPRRRPGSCAVDRARGC